MHSELFVRRRCYHDRNYETGARVHTSVRDLFNKGFVVLRKSLFAWENVQRGPRPSPWVPSEPKGETPPDRG